MKLSQANYNCKKGAAITQEDREDVAGSIGLIASGANPSLD
jgi:hypothetical protein